MPLNKLEQLINAGFYLQAKREAERLLLGWDTATPSQRGRIEWSACVASLYLNELYAAAKHGERAVQLAQEAQDSELLAHAHYDLGITYVHVGDTHLASQHLLTFLGMSEQMGADQKRCIAAAKFNLARVHRQRREYGTAAQLLREAAALFNLVGSARPAASCELDLAWMHLLLERPAESLPHIEAADAYASAYSDAVMAADLRCARAMYCQLTGDLPQSVSLCETVFQPGQEGITDHQLAEAAWIMGTNAVLMGRLQEAQIFANMATEYAIKFGWPLGMNLACDLRRRIAAYSSQPVWSDTAQGAAG